MTQPWHSSKAKSGFIGCQGNRYEPLSKILSTTQLQRHPKKTATRMNVCPSKIRGLSQHAGKGTHLRLRFKVATHPGSNSSRAIPSPKPAAPGPSHRAAGDMRLDEETLFFRSQSWRGRFSNILLPPWNGPLLNFQLSTRLRASVSRVRVRKLMNENPRPLKASPSAPPQVQG